MSFPFVCQIEEEYPNDPQSLYHCLSVVEGQFSRVMLKVTELENLRNEYEVQRNRVDRIRRESERAVALNERFAKCVKEEKLAVLKLEQVLLRFFDVLGLVTTQFYERLCLGSIGCSASRVRTTTGFRVAVSKT